MWLVGGARRALLLRSLRKWGKSNVTNAEILNGNPYDPVPTDTHTNTRTVKEASSTCQVLQDQETLPYLP